jgi:hypothetical protein
LKIDDFANTVPAFRPEVFFAQRLEGWGVLEGPTGALQKRFTVTAQGSRDGEVIHFRETWTFDDGHVDTLNWRIRVEGDGRYTGAEDRVEGEAQGEVAGSAFHWTYTRETPQPDGKSIKLNFDDWFFQIDEVVVIAKGVGGRLGLPFASAHVTYRALG